MLPGREREIRVDTLVSDDTLQHGARNAYNSMNQALFNFVNCLLGHTLFCSLFSVQCV